MRGTITKLKFTTNPTSQFLIGRGKANLLSRRKASLKCVTCSSYREEVWVAQTLKILISSWCKWYLKKTDLQKKKSCKNNPCKIFSDGIHHIVGNCEWRYFHPKSHPVLPVSHTADDFRRQLWPHFGAGQTSQKCRGRKLLEKYSQPEIFRGVVFLGGVWPRGNSRLVAKLVWHWGWTAEKHFQFAVT